MNSKDQQKLDTPQKIKWDYAPIADANAVQADYGDLLVLTILGELYGLNLDTGVQTKLCEIVLPEIDHSNDHEHFGISKFRLCSSFDGKCAAVVIDHGQIGLLIETSCGRIITHLNGGNYYEETVPFSACFIHFEGRNLFIHRTDWNRLDVTDPASGEIITNRLIAPYGSQEKRPEHYLDYFHGKIIPSPNNNQLFDDGWVWHPLSVPRTWSIKQWLTTYPWESEDGNSIIDFPLGDNWNLPACWIDDQRIAMWGIPTWDKDEEMEMRQDSGVAIYGLSNSQTTIEKSIPFANKNKCNYLFSNGRNLYVVTDAGTNIWDINSEQQVCELENFNPQIHNKHTDTLIAFNANSICILPLSAIKFNSIE
ncbi:hypothetical protein KDM92_11315 [Undibacterium sp. BYS107W]|uniref:Uncharacterized protein n=2 Tax=Undibacterium baiyunense TaxID=2828731 RepID=A0A941I269_9BURK|nr:hypothetical protein [Undibacterium baiyunense]